MTQAPRPRLALLVVLTGLSVLSLNMFLPALASIAADFEADYALVSLAVAGYLAVTAVVQLVVGPLSDRVGRRPVLLVSLAIFVLASALAAMAEDVWTFLLCRMFQAAMISGHALSAAMVRDTASEREATGLIGTINMAMAVAPMLGPMLGGVLDTYFGWRANFWLYAGAGATLLALCWVDLPETRTRGTQGNTRRETLLLLGDRRFWGFALCTAFSIGAFYIFLAGAPLVATETFGVSSATLGIFVGSITAGFFLGSAVARRLAARFAPATLMVAGRVVACSGLGLGLLLWAVGVQMPVTYFGATVFVGMGNGITLPSSNVGAMSVRPGLAGTAAGVNGALTVATGAALTSLAGVQVTGEGQAVRLFLLMLASAGVALLAALWARAAGKSPAPR